MYSTKLTVSHSICSELTPPKKYYNSRCLFVRFLLHSKSFTSDKVVKSTQCASPCTYYVQTKRVHPLPSPANSRLRLDFNIKKKKEIKIRRGMGIQKGYGCFLSECLSGNNLSKIKKQFQNPTLHSVQPVYKRCHVGKILYLVNFKACQDGEPHRHYTIILGHKGLLHSLARGWNHSVTSCKQREKQKYFLVNLLTWVLCR